MINISLFKKPIKQGIKFWLKSITTNIEIQTLELIVNNKYFIRVEELYLKARNLIYQDFYINKIIIKIYNFNLRFNYKNHIIYSDDMVIDSILEIDKVDLENIFFSSKIESLRIKIQHAFAKGCNVSSLVIENNLITMSYQENKLENKIFLSLSLEDNLIFLENIKSKKKFKLPFDKNIKINSCQIKNDHINIDLSSRVIFDN